MEELVKELISRLEEYKLSESGFVKELIEFIDENIRIEKLIADDSADSNEVTAHMYAAYQYEVLKGWIESKAKNLGGASK